MPITIQVYEHRVYLVEYLVDTEDESEAEIMAEVGETLSEDEIKIISVINREVVKFGESLEDVKNVEESYRPISSYYKDGLCPDCQEEIDVTYEEGDQCPNCGHVFWKSRETDDEV